MMMWGSAICRIQHRTYQAAGLPILKILCISLVMGLVRNSASLLDEVLSI